MNRIAAEVHGRPTAELRLVAQVGGVGDRHRKAPLDVTKLSQTAARHDLADARRERVVAIVIGLAENQAGALRSRDHLLRLGGIQAEGLLAQHMLAGLERGDGPRCVLARWKWVVDTVDVVARDQIRVARRHLRDVVLGGELLGALRIARGHCNHARCVAAGTGHDQRSRRDLRSAENPESQLAQGVCCRQHDSGSSRSPSASAR
jgi:hypothetical protein